MPNDEDLIRARQRSRSRIMALLLGGFAVLMFGISIAKIKAEAGQEIYEPTLAQVAEWKKAAQPLEEKWAENVKKTGVDPATVMKELKAQLSKEGAGY